MDFDDIVPLLIALYVLWNVVRGLTARREPPPAKREEPEDASPTYPWEPHWESEPTPVPTPVSPRAPSHAAQEPGVKDAYAELATWNAAIEAAHQRSPREDIVLRSLDSKSADGIEVAARSRAQALLASRSDLVRAIVAHEILGRPVSER